MSSTTVPARASGAAASSASSASGQTSVKGSPVAAVEDCNPHRERVVQGIDPGRLAVREPIELGGQGLVHCPGAIRMAMAGVKKAGLHDYSCIAEGRVSDASWVLPTNSRQF
jgi:hypothetical protein